MSELEHRVYARQPNHPRSTFVAAFALSRWQWAEKLYQFLLDKGWDDVRLETMPVSAKVYQ